MEILVHWRGPLEYGILFSKERSVRKVGNLAENREMNEAKEKELLLNELRELRIENEILRERMQQIKYLVSLK